MIFDTLGATLLGNMLAGKGVFIYKGTVFLIPYHLLTNFQIQRYHKSKSKSNVVYSRHNWSKMKDGKYVTDLNEYN